LTRPAEDPGVLLASEDVIRPPTRRRSMGNRRDASLLPEHIQPLAGAGPGGCPRDCGNDSVRLPLRPGSGGV